MKILYVGALFDGSTALHRLNGLRESGCEVECIDTTLPFRYAKRPTAIKRLAKFFFYRTDALIDWKNVGHKMLAAAKTQKFDILWIDKGLGIRPEILRRFTDLSPRTRLVNYSPDDMNNPANQTARYLNAISLYNLHVTTKTYNVEELKEMGANNVFFVGNAYEPSVHKPVKLSPCERQKIGSDVVFVGTVESERLSSLSLLAQRRISLGLHGGGQEWLNLARKFPNIKASTGFVASHEYSRLICASKIALGFLRKQNRDLQTTRSIEIPATGTFMLAERTDEHLGLFEEGKEAEFFSSDEELIEKVEYYLAHDDERETIAAAGRERCLRSGYSNADRMKTVLRYLNNV